MKNNHKYVSKGTVTNIKSPNGNDLDKVIDLLKIPTQKRTKSEIKIIQNYMINNIEYFRKMSQEPDEIERIPKIIQILNYECFQKDEPIINYGEIGDKFYIILSGNINVYKPSPKNVYMTLYDYVKYLVNIRDIQNNQLKFERIQNYNSNIDRVKLVQINYNPEKLPYSIKKLPVVIEEERLISKLVPGASFGEMALIKHERRNADIIADETCILGRIDKIDYKKILKDIEEQKINTQLKSFKMDFPFFSEWPPSKCFRIISAFTNEYYNKEDYVYRQNTISNHIYIIRKGEFEVTCDINFSIYEQFIEYIHSNPDILFKDSDQPGFWKEDNLEKKINSAYEKNTTPFLSLHHISKFVLSHKSENLNTLKKNENLTSENLNYLDEKKMEEISKKEDMEDEIKYQNSMIRRIKICKLEAPQIFGFMEPFELKRRFCNIRCDSNQGEIQKIPLIEFLQLMPKDKNNLINLLKYVFNRKKDLMERLKNGVLAKLSFNLKKPQMKSLGLIYPSRNLDNNLSKKSKLFRNKSTFLNYNNNSINNNTIQNESYDINKNSSDNETNTNMKNKKNIIYGFKKALFSFNDDNVKYDIKNLVNIYQNKKKKREIMNIGIPNGSNSMRIPKYFSQNSVTNILPTKFSLFPHPKTIGRNYIDYNSKKIMREIKMNSAIFDDIIKRTEVKQLPIINSNIRSNSLKDQKLQNLRKFQRKVKKNVTVLFPRKG